MTVGAGSSGGGLVGENQGIIRNAFATGNVVGAAGLAARRLRLTTRLGGFVGGNKGVIAHTFATGAVGGANIANLDAGGLVGNNGGVIWRSFASGPVTAGGDSLAGGIAGENDVSRLGCDGCVVGDGVQQARP